MCFQNNNFGTISSSLIALPSVNMQHKVDQPAFEWLFAGGSPDSEEYSKITI
jgi:hypothetical protein